MVDRPDWALVLGGADCVWWDVAMLEKIVGKGWPGYIVAVNDIGVHWVRDIHAWCSLHTDKLMAHAREKGQDNGSWLKQRERKGLPGGYVTYGKGRKKHGVDKHVPMPYGGGSSGLLGGMVARDLGAKKIVYAGCPMSVRPHFERSLTHHAERDWTAANSHYRAWTRAQEDLKRDMRSMSGRTRQLLGPPTLDWLHG